MILELYFVRLRSITEFDLESIRQWRNSDYVKNSMLFKSFISAKQQKQWYNTINNNNNYYFIIEINGEAAGVANIKDINRKSLLAEPGIFFTDLKYSNGIFPLNTGLMLVEAAFYLLGLNSLHSKVIINNTAAYKFNKNLGYKLITTNNEDDFFRFILTPLQFEQPQKIIRNALAVLDDSFPLKKNKLVLTQEEFLIIENKINYDYFEVNII